MKNKVRTIVVCAGAVLVLVAAVVLLNLRQTPDFHEKYEGYDLTADAEMTKRKGTYAEYLRMHEDITPDCSVAIDLHSYVEGTNVSVNNEYEDGQNALFTGEKSSVTWEIEVQEAGWYCLRMEYMTVPSKGVMMERAVYINGELPFTNASDVIFTRTWTDAGEPKMDNRGNEIRPTQVEVQRWQTAYFKDKMGYVSEPYRFYFEKGKNTLTLEAVNEPMIIRALSLTAVTSAKTYAEYSAEQSGSHATGEGADYISIIEGEDSTFRSESSLYAKYDRSSPATSPCSVTTTVLNYIGGDAWRTTGQWIEWDISVPEDGYYRLCVKGRQNYARGSVSNRSLLIDGELPFAEVSEIAFDYSNEWNCLIPGDGEGNPYLFWLTKGTHTVRLEATLGSLGEILSELEDSTYRLNQIYRKILVYTGATPDQYRDYHIENVYPDIMEAINLESKRLYKIVDDMVAYTGQKADKIATAQTIAQQLERFYERPEKITVEFTTFKENISALGAAILNLSEIKLDVDYIAVLGETAEFHPEKEGGFRKLAHEVKAFFSSFFMDYDAVGDVYEDGDPVTVWVSTGRDQGTILKTMIDDTFTPNTGIPVNVEIVSNTALLSATVAGNGPNVVLSVGADQPVNFALRNAAEDLTQFSDYKEVLEWFYPSTYRQYCLEDSVYALPETMTYNVMFYRKDVLEELGLGIPQTWQELIEMLPTIQGNNLSVAIPSAAGASGVTAVDLSMYFTLLYQNGGELYNEQGTATIIDNESGVQALKQYTKYFTDYGIPTVYDFVTRFRSGEMPLGIINFATYNTLVVSAPEIAGLWGFTLVPGTERQRDDGTTYVDRSTFISGSATMMLKIEDENLKNDAWEFMKWWASEDTQVRFGRELEALLGSSARYATANKNAFSNLAWSADDIAVLEEQLGYTVGIREVPGGYYTGRHISNAFRKVINEKADPRETVIEYSIKIDEELTKKRKEFGLPVE